MKKIKNILLLVSMLLVNTAYAQRVQNIEDWMNSLISKAIDNNVEVTKSLGRERDIQKEGTPLKWRCDIYQFTLTKKQRPLLDEMIKAFEANGNDNPNCYGINTLTTINPQNEGKRNLIIGDDINRYVTIGEQYGNYVNVNILDATDTTKTHRYAYALEWKEDPKGNVIARYIVTYAKIPSNPISSFKVIKKEIDPKKLNRLGDVRIQELNETLGLDLSSEENETVGGLVVELLDHLPETGESVAMGNVRFTVREMDKNRIGKLSVQVPEKKESF